MKEIFMIIVKLFYQLRKYKTIVVENLTITKSKEE